MEDNRAITEEDPCFVSVFRVINRYILELSSLAKPIPRSLSIKRLSSLKMLSQFSKPDIISGIENT